MLRDSALHTEAVRREDSKDLQEQGMGLQYTNEQVLEEGYLKMMYNKNLLKCHLEMNCLPVPEDHVETTSLRIQKTGLVTIYMT